MGIPGLIPVIERRHGQAVFSEPVQARFVQSRVVDIASRAVACLMTEPFSETQGGQRRKRPAEAEGGEGDDADDFDDGAWSDEEGAPKVAEGKSRFWAADVKEIKRTPLEYTRRFLNRFRHWATVGDSQTCERCIVFASDDPSEVPPAKRAEQDRRKSGRNAAVERARANGRYIEYAKDVIFCDEGPEIDGVSIMAQSWARHALTKYLRHSIQRHVLFWHTKTIIDMPTEEEKRAILVCGDGVDVVEYLPGSGLGEAERAVVHWLKRIYQPGSKLLPKTAAHVPVNLLGRPPAAAITTLDSDIVPISFALDTADNMPPVLLWDYRKGQKYIDLNALFRGWRDAGIRPRELVVATLVLGNDYLNRNTLVKGVNPPTAFERAIRCLRDLNAKGATDRLSTEELVRRVAFDVHMRGDIFIPATRSAEVKKGKTAKVSHATAGKHPPPIVRQTFEVASGIIDYWLDTEHSLRDRIPIVQGNDRPSRPAAPAPVSRKRGPAAKQTTDISDLAAEADNFGDT